MTFNLGPRLVIAGTSSGVGKTTIATGIMAALSHAGLKVASAKVGPDFIDPGYHQVATDRPGRNLDAWMCGDDQIAPLAARAAVGTDILIVEGVMGLFDGVGSSQRASTAWTAKLLDAPVVLVLDASSLSSSVAAFVHGFSTWDPAVRLAGVILNRVGSQSHDEILREALSTLPSPVPVLGSLFREDSLEWRSRHLGLVPVAEHHDAVKRSVRSLGEIVAAGVDVEELVRIARSAPPLQADRPVSAKHTGNCRIAVAGGPAFSFLYEDNRELLEQAGAELVDFDPLRDKALPEGADALIAGGGFPEIYAAELSENAPLLEEVRLRASEGLPIWAECGGMLWLGSHLDGKELCGVLPIEAHMTKKLTLGYREATLKAESFVGPAGTQLRGHVFHYSIADPAGNEITMSGRLGNGDEGFCRPRLLASYLHIHMGSAPWVAERFVACASNPSSHRP